MMDFFMMVHRHGRIERLFRPAPTPAVDCARSRRGHLFGLSSCCVAALLILAPAFFSSCRMPSAPDGGAVRKPFFLSDEPLSDRLPNAPSEREIGVPRYPGARLLEDKCLSQGARLCLYFESGQALGSVLNFYEARLHCRATPAGGRSGLQYSLGTVSADGTRSIVVLENKLVKHRPVGTIIRIFVEKPVARKGSRHAPRGRSDG